MASLDVGELPTVNESINTILEDKVSWEDTENRLIEE